MKKFVKFFGLGVGTTLIEYLVFTLVARLTGNDLLFIATLVGGIVATIVSYILNRKFIWKNAKTGKKEVISFFVYNLVIKTLVIKEIFTFLFGLIKPLYEFAFSISSSLHLPFDYAFVESTGIFVLTAGASMFITYFVYDKLIFKSNKNECGQDVDMKSVLESGKEKQGNKEA